MAGCTQSENAPTEITDSTTSATQTTETVVLTTTSEEPPTTTLSTTTETTPTFEPDVRFPDCTTVEVTADRFTNVLLYFENAGTQQFDGPWDGERQFAGTGENEGRIVSKAEIYGETGAHAESNPDLTDCVGTTTTTKTTTETTETTTSETSTTEIPTPTTKTTRQTTETTTAVPCYSFSLGTQKRVEDGDYFADIHFVNSSDVTVSVDVVISYRVSSGALVGKDSASYEVEASSEIDDSFTFEESDEYDMYGYDLPTEHEASAIIEGPNVGQGVRWCRDEDESRV